MFFLKNEKYSFFDAVTTPDELDSGYYIELVSEQLDYQSFLSNEYLDNNTLSAIIDMLKTAIDSYLED